MRTLTIALIAAAASILLYSATIIKTVDTIPPHVIGAFNEWKKVYGNLYQSPSENNYRLKIFYKNFKEVEEINSKNLGWKAGINQFTGMSDEEFSTKYLGVPKEMLEQQTEFKYKNSPRRLQAPTKVDWRGKGILVDEIQDQKQCGSCWAFATSAVAEAAYNIAQKTTTPKKFSEQQIVDCVTANWGCRGGWPKTAFKYLIEQSGLTELQNYPYVAFQGACDFDKIVNPTDPYHDWWMVEKNNEALKTANAQQPISIILHVSLGFNKYKSGVFKDATPGECVNTSIGLHAVTLVGYDTTSADGAHWVLKNEWGAAWGDNGYIRVAMIDGTSGVCNMHMSSTYIEY